MTAYPDSHASFGYMREPCQNPFTGFTSFNHFNNGRLYSDVVVKPENRLLETEALECYPVPDDVPENGSDEGYYPDTSVAYIRFLWKDFEPERGQYDYGFVQRIIDSAADRSKSLIIRMMPHSTRAEDDVPRWLKKIIPCPERPAGMRVKDSPTDPLFIKLFSEAVRRLGERFDKCKVLYAVDVCLPGAWGEGYNLSIYKDEDVEYLIRAFTDSFKETLLIGQIARPDMLMKLSRERRIGWRADGFGDPYHIKEYYPPLVESLKDLWKTSPVSVESYWWLGEWYRQGWNIDELADLSLQWHVSLVNAKSLPIPHSWKKNVDRWVDRMGYHFRILRFSYPGKAVRGDMAVFGLVIENTGVAPLYVPVPLEIRLCPKIYTGRDDPVLLTSVDTSRWFPGTHSETIPFRIPEDIPAGSYSVCVSISDGLNNVYFCSDAERQGRYSVLADIEVI